MRLRILLGLFIAATVVQAQSPGDSSARINYFHADNHAELRTFDGRILQSIEAGTDRRLEVRVPQTVPLCIADPNPVFFKYSKGKSTITPNPNWAAALALAKTLQPIGRLESTFRGTDAEDPVSALKDYAAQIPRIAGLTLGNDVQSAKDEVRAWDLDMIRDALKGGRGGRTAAAGTSSVSGGSGTSSLSFGTTANDFNSPPAGNAPGTPQTPPQTATPPPKSLEERVKQLEDELRGAKAKQEAAVKAAIQEQQDEQKQMDDAMELLNTLKVFKDAVLGVNVPVCLDGEPVNMQEDPTVHIIIEPIPLAPGVVAPARKTGDVAIPLRAYSPVALSFGPAMVYSFVKAPSFSAEKQADGKFKITEKEGKNRAQNISAMLNITPRAWRDATFGGSFQVGISPVKDQMGIFAGVQLRVANLVTLGGGYGFQQVPRLSREQSVGAILDTAEALKTDTHYKGGAYVSLTLSLPTSQKE